VDYLKYASMIYWFIMWRGWPIVSSKRSWGFKYRFKGSCKKVEQRTEWGRDDCSL